MWKILLVILFLLAASVLFGGLHGFVLGAIAAGLAVRYSLTCRDGTALHVFSAIHAAIRQNLPLPTALAAEAEGQTPQTARSLEGISAWLSEGQPLGEAIRRGFPRCPGYALGMVIAGERVGQVPRAVAAARDHLAAAVTVKEKVRPVKPAYPVAVLVVAMLLVWALSAFVMPKFQDIFAGMGTDLPAPTRLLFDMTSGGMPLLSVVLILSVFLGVPLAIYFAFRPRRPDRPRTTSRIWDFIKWHMPVVHWFERSLSTSRTLGLLRLALNSGVPVDEAISAAMTLDLNDCYRRRLENWLRRVQRGEDLARAARKSRVGSAVAWAFDAHAGPGAPVVLGTVEEIYRAQYACAAAWARGIVWPVVILGVGVLVGLVVYSLFLPLSELVETSVRTMVP